ncbi:MAG: asparagine synthase-related protein [Limisphaerales bacterium]|jgi:asparagine synthase (glutamine-hydrolysing)|nr:asparagine synthetase B family protein [Verrucomicrobiota bacterium]
MKHEYVERVVNLIDPQSHRLHNMNLQEATERVLSGKPDAVRQIDGSFALLAKEEKTVRMARSMDRPMRYFLAKRAEGPALIVADRMDKIADWLKAEGLDDQFHPSYTRMVPAHYVVEIQLVGCPDPDPVYTRYFDPQKNTQPGNLDIIGQHYIGALAEAIQKWIASLPPAEPIGVCFSGGIDSGAVFLTTHHVMQKMGTPLTRLKAFTLNLGGGADAQQARSFLSKTGHTLFLEEIQASLDELQVEEILRTIEDYKPLDVECAAMGMLLHRSIRKQYPDWKFLIDGDGGDENLKDYPIEDNPELTIRSVLHNQMLYHEGWGVGKIKHSLTYSGGLSRSYTRTYAPAQSLGFEGFSPFTRPEVIAVSEGIPYIDLTDYQHGRLYDLKGSIVSRGVKAITGIDMPVFEKRRFQHGAIAPERLREAITHQEPLLRRRFHALYEGS